MSVEEQIAAAQKTEDDAWESAFNDAVTGRSSGEEAQDEPEEADEPEEQGEAADEPGQDTEQTDEEQPEELTLEQRLKKVEEERDRYLQERDQYRHQFMSNSGRITAYQRQIQNMEAQIEGKTRQKGESQEDAQERIAKEMNDSSWEELEQDFPEVAKALEKRLDARVSQAVEERLGDFNQKLQPIQDRIHQQDLQAERSALEAEHPDWLEIVNSDEYREWIADKPEPVRQLENSPSAADAAYILSSFKRDTGQARSNSRAELQTQRKQRLEQSITPSSRRSVKREIADDDFDAAWDAAIRDRTRNN